MSTASTRSSDADPMRMFEAFRSPFGAVGFGASHGGVEALSTILAALPSSFPAPIVIAQHLPPAHSLLVPLLAGKTRLDVRWAEMGTRIRPETVYVGPPGFDVRVARNGTIALRRRAQRNDGRPAADALFGSLASALGSRAIAVVLSGHLQDGAAGASLVAARGGVVIAQDPRLCVAPSMPTAAIAAGAARFVLPAESIASALVSLVSVPGGAALFGVA